MMSRLTSFVLATVATWSTTAMSYDFAEADALFKRRAESQEVIESAKAKYQAAVPQVAGDELVYAVEKIARLFYYEVLKTPDTDKAKRKALTQAAMAQLDAISPSKVAANPQYYYWKATHLSLFAKANGILESLSRSKELVALIDSGRKVDSTYEGGGFDRLGGIVYAKLPALNPWGPSGDKVLAKQLFERAINSPAYSKETEHVDTESGDYHFAVFVYFAELLIDTGNSEEARTLLTSAIERLEQDGDFPPKRDAETRIDLQSMKDLLAKIQ